MSESALLQSRPSSLPLAAGTFVTLTLLLTGFLSILWTPYPTAAIDVGAALQDPGAAHWLGTDPLGRDVLSLLMKSAFTSFVIAAIAVIIGALFGIPLGLLATRRPGSGAKFRDSLTSLLVLVSPLIAAAIIATNFGASAIVSTAAIGSGAIASMAAATVAAVHAYATRGYLDAARLAGLSRWEAIRRHVWRQMVKALAAEAIALLGVCAVWETILGFLGLGSQPPAASFGLMLHDAQPYLAAKPLLAVLPGATLLVLVLGLRLVSRGLRRQQGVEAASGSA